VAVRSSITRMSVDQKQVLVQRSAEDERHQLHSALVRESELSSSDVDNNVDVPPPPSSENQQTAEKDLTDDQPASTDKNRKPGVMPEPGTCCSSTMDIFNCSSTLTAVPRSTQPSTLRGTVK